MNKKYISGKVFIEYPLFTFYKDSSLSLSQIVSHYNQRFYLIEYDHTKSKKVLDTIFSLKNFSKLSYRSNQLKLPVNCDELLSCVNSSLWFKFQSNKTKALGVLIAASLWEEKVNNQENLISSLDFRNDILTIFQKLVINADLTEDEYLNYTIPGNKEKAKIEAKKEYERIKSEELSSFTQSWSLIKFCEDNLINSITSYKREGKTVFELNSIGRQRKFAFASINLTDEEQKKIIKEFPPYRLKMFTKFVRIGLLNDSDNSIIRYIIYDDEEIRKTWEKMGLPYGL